MAQERRPPKQAREKTRQQEKDKRQPSQQMMGSALVLESWPPWPVDAEGVRGALSGAAPGGSPSCSTGCYKHKCAVPPLPTPPLPPLVGRPCHGGRPQPECRRPPPHTTTRAPGPPSIPTGCRTAVKRGIRPQTPMHPPTCIGCPQRTVSPLTAMPSHLPAAAASPPSPHKGSPHHLVNNHLPKSPW